MTTFKCIRTFTLAISYFIVWNMLSIAPLQADVLWLKPQLLNDVKKQHGETAVKRVTAWKTVLENTDKTVLEKLTIINNFINTITYGKDIDTWGTEDYWATPIEALSKGMADCEDYAIAKYFSLVELGVNDEKLKIMYVKAIKTNEAHMVLAYYPNVGSMPLILDNLDHRILLAEARTDLIPVYGFNASSLWILKHSSVDIHLGSSDRVTAWQRVRAQMLSLSTNI